MTGSATPPNGKPDASPRGTASAPLGKEEGAPRPVSSVLFVCGMNAIRSPMAEVIARSLLPGRLHVESAGATSGQPDPFAETVIAEMGLSLAGHEPKALEDLEDTYYDLVVTLSPEAHHRTLEFTRSQPVEVEYWPTMDPSTVAGSREQILEAYRQVRDALKARIRERFSGN